MDRFTARHEKPPPVPLSDIPTEETVSEAVKSTQEATIIILDEFRPKEPSPEKSPLKKYATHEELTGLFHEIHDAQEHWETLGLRRKPYDEEVTSLENALWRGCFPPAPVKELLERFMSFAD